MSRQNETASSGSLPERTRDRWLIALDIDGTVLLEGGAINDAVIKQVQRVRDLGHEVMLATGRSASSASPRRPR